MKKLIQLLLMVCLLAGGVLAQGEGVAPSGQDPNPAHGPAQKPTMEMEDSEFFLTNFLHLLPHPQGLVGADGQVHEFTFYNMNLFQLITSGLILLIFLSVLKSFTTGKAGFFTRVFRGWVLWLRDELVYNVMGPEDGKKFAPYFMYLFFFIAFMNLLGMLPLIGVTATGTFWVTGTLALITFIMMLGFGFQQQGVLPFFKNLVPHGLPIALIPLLAVVELIGLFIKPFALMIRLFANMLAGHMIIYSFVGMIFLFAKMLEMSFMPSLLTAVPAAGMGVFISIIESFIALLQAYIFVFLSVIFVHQSMHPAH